MGDETTAQELTPTVTDDHLWGSLPGRLVLAARRRPGETALLQKRLGIYVRYTWEDYLDAVFVVSHSLAQLGIGPGSVVAILSDNRVEWVFTDLAAQAVGAVAVGVYPTSPPTEVAYTLGHSRANLVVVEDQEQVDKVLAVRDELPDLHTIVVIDPRGTRGYPRELVAWPDFIELGEAGRAADPQPLPQRLARLRPDDPAVLIYTSGTTSAPKAAVWSHRVMTTQADRLVTTFGMSAEDTVLSYLPLSHGAEKLITELVPLSTGGRVHFGESVATVQSDLVEVGPTVFVGMPRIWEKIRSSVEKGLRQSTPLNRWAFRRALAAGERLVERSARGETRWRDRAIRRAIDLLVFRALREHVGLARAWFVMSGGAPIGPDLLHWLRAIGVPVVEAYGLTEAGVTHVARPDDPPRIGTVGQALSDVECRIDDDGEILLRSGTNFMGYLHDSQSTEETLTADGWVRTGDLGEHDEDGYLRIVGRKKDIIITAGGKNLSPSAIENAMKSSPYIAQAVPIGDARPFVSALIQIDWDSVADWAAEHQVPYTSFEDLAGKPEIVALIEGEVGRGNELLARVSQVRKFRLLPKQLHQDDGELTATQKVRRNAVLAKFPELVDEIYGEVRR
jgi:long-chain acyl-CoA synthetase